MQFNRKTLAHLKSLDSVLITSEWKIVQSNSKQRTATVNKVDTYKKRNGKLCKVYHHFQKYVKDIPLEYYAQVKHTGHGTSNEWLVSERDDYTYTYYAPMLKSDCIAKVIKMAFREGLQ